MSSSLEIKNAFQKLSISTDNEEIIFTITDNDNQSLQSDLILKNKNNEITFNSLRNEASVSYSLTWKEIVQLNPSNKQYTFNLFMSNLLEETSLNNLNTTWFESTQIDSIDPIIFENNTITIYLDVFSNNIYIHLNDDSSREKIILNNEITNLSLEKSNFKIDGLLTLHTLHSEKIVLLIKNQQNTISIIQPVDFTHYKQENTKTTYSFSTSINLANLNKQMRIFGDADELFSIQMRIELEESNYPIVDSLTFPDPAHYTKTLPQKSINYGRNAYLFAFSFSAQGLLEMNALFYKKETLVYKEERQKTIYLTRPFNQQQSIWLFGGETPYQINKNTWAVFIEALKKYPDKQIYYILDSSSSDWEWAHSYVSDQILPYKSKKYIWNLLLAEKIITSGPIFNHLPSRSPIDINLIRAEKTMIPEGIVGLSNEQWRLNQTNKLLQLDNIVVSTKVERRFLLESLHFNSSQIIVSGLPNQEELMNSNKTNSSYLILFPKHMQYRFQSPKEKKTNQWESLMNNSSFIEFCKTNKLIPTLILSKQDTSFFSEDNYLKDKGVKTIVLEETDLSEILQSTKMLITDYQSEALNFALLQQPIFFFQTDNYVINTIQAAEYKMPGIQNDLPGEIVTNEQDLLFLMQQSQQNNFSLSRNHSKKAINLTPTVLEKTDKYILDALS